MGAEAKLKMKSAKRYTVYRSDQLKPPFLSPPMRSPLLSEVGAARHPRRGRARAQDGRSAAFDFFKAVAEVHYLKNEKSVTQ